MNEINTYSEFTRNYPLKRKFRDTLRDLSIAVQSVGSNINNSTNWIRMIYYHHVFDDERKDFERQLRYLKNYGDFISMDQVLEISNGDNSLDGRYFCISFDDGFHNTYTNMLEITSRLQVPVIIYLPTDFIGSEPHELNYDVIYERFAPRNTKFLRFLNWDQCREMLDHNITFGSHTTSHPVLNTVSDSELEYELVESKRMIEEQLGTACIHFACPKGRIDKHFNPAITKKLAIKAGYKSIVSTNRGPIRAGDDPYLLHREHLIAAWGNYQIKFFFGK